MEDLVLDLLEFLLVSGALDDQFVLLLLELRLLLGGDDAEQLVLQALWRDHEVEQRHLHRDLRQVVRVAQTRRHVEPKVGRVLNHVVAQLQIIDALTSPTTPPLLLLHPHTVKMSVYTPIF